jgi:hypothetical protein
MEIMVENKFREWEIKHWQNIFEELRGAGITLENENIETIVNFMSFEVRSKRNLDGCRLYVKKESCHPEITDLNCLLCACPNYDSSKAEGGCRIGSKHGFY